MKEDQFANISNEAAWMGDGDDMGMCCCGPAAVRSRMGSGPLDLKDTRGRTMCSTSACEVTVRRRGTPSTATTATATTPFLPLCEFNEQAQLARQIRFHFCRMKPINCHYPDTRYLLLAIGTLYSLKKFAWDVLGVIGQLAKQAFYVQLHETSVLSSIVC